MKSSIRAFDTGATRDSDDSKPDYEAFLSPLVMVAFGLYMNRHRTQPDGVIRAGDNWQKGMPLDAYMKSAWRHFLDLWFNHRDYAKKYAREGIVKACCAIIFNVQGYLHEYLKEHPEEMTSGGE